VIIGITVPASCISESLKIFLKNLSLICESINPPEIFILQTERIYRNAPGKVPGWRSAVWLYCKFNRCAV